MTIKTKSKNKLVTVSFGSIVSIVMFFVMWQIGKAESISNLSNANTETNCKMFEEETDERDKCEELEKRADVYREIIEIKKKQGETLNDQLSIADSNIDQIQAQMDVTDGQINDYNSQITRIESQIREKDSVIKRQRAVLADLVQSYYEVNLASPLISYLNDGNIASFIIKKDRIAQTGDKIKEIVDSVNAIKTDLETQNVELDKKKTEFVLTKEKLEGQGADLENVKKQKATLLAQTKGEENRYAELLARVQQQKAELLDIDQFFAASGLSVDSYPKPDSKYFAPTSWYFSQRDPRWGNDNIGNTKTLMKSYGCAVTAVAMVFNQHGGSITPGKLANEPIFSGDLINWPAAWTSPKVSLTSSGKSHGNINWSTIDAQIAKGNPVIVYIGKTKGGGGHYVVIHHKAKDGQYVVHDPYFGPNIFLNTTRALVGAMGVNSSTTINQMIIYN